jgi:branched-chain amino acid transport system substrate-binding protein
LIFGPKHFIALGTQWQKGDLVVVWPDGKAALGDQAWKGMKFEGTREFELPPWMVEYWKGKKAK